MMVDLAEYTRRYEAQYGTGPGWFEQVLVEMRRRRVLGTLDRHRPRAVLEIGCGIEPLVTHWDHAERYTIVEPSPRFVARARLLAPKTPVYNVIEGYLESVTREVSSLGPYDCVIASSLLHEVPEPRALLAAIRDVSAGHTVIHINVPNVRSFHRLLAVEMGLIPDVFERSAMEASFGRQTRFDREVLETMLQESGYRVTAFATYFIKPFTHAQMERVFDEGILPRKALDALDSLSDKLPGLGAEMWVEARLA